MDFNFQRIPPSPRLRPFVRTFWFLEGNLPAQGSYIHRHMADCCPQIFFHYKGLYVELTETGDVSQGASGIHGQSGFHRRFQTSESFGMFGAYLYPYALPGLFGISALSCSNYLPDLRSVLGSRGTEIEEKMMLAENNRERWAVLNHFLEECLDKQKWEEHPVMQAIHQVIHSDQPIRVDELACRYNLSQRQLERKFIEWGGFSPKLCLRIARFQTVLHKYPARQFRSLTEIAYECGYYDQSHFIHDFISFSGYHPKKFFAGSNEATAWRNP
jgi:AraC-like DNA-binding protein